MAMEKYGLWAAGPACWLVPACTAGRCLLAGARPPRRAMAWSEETLGDASKKELVQFLQKWCTPEFLKQHKLNGQVKAIVKKAKMPALREAYTTAMTTPKEHMTTEGYDEVRAMVSVEEESIEEEEKSSVDPKSQKMLQMVYKQREKIEAVFKEFDENNQGTVSDEEFAMALELLGVDVESPKIKQLMEECTDGGQVNFVRFLTSVQPVTLLDAKRSSNISIMLAQFRISFDDIKIAILVLNEAILDAETVEKMVPNCPEPSDMALVNAYEGDLKLLGKAELYFREVGQIPRLQVRRQRSTPRPTDTNGSTPRPAHRSPRR
jgi:hypothetical protein